MKTISADRKRYFEQLAKDLKNTVRQVKIPYRYRFMYWTYYILLATKGVQVQDEKLDGQYEDGKLSRGYKKYLGKINNHIAKHYQSSQSTSTIPTFARDEIEEHEVPLLMNLRIPFVLKGGANHLKMMDWDLDFFDENFGGCEVPINVAPDVPGENKKLPSKATNYYDFRKGTVGDVIHSIRTGGNMRSIAVEDVMHQRDGRLIDDIDIPMFERMSGWIDYRNHWFKAKMMVGKVVSKQLFLQPKYAYTVWHSEPADNIFLLHSGKKTWTIAHPYHSAVMKPRVKANTTYHGTSIDVRESNEVQKERGFDAYTAIPKFRIDIEKGDILRLPNFWWHTVETFTEEYSIAVTLRTPCLPNMTSLGYTLLRIADKDYREMVRRLSRGGRVTDNDVNFKIFQDLDKKKNQFELDQAADSKQA